MQRPLPEAQAPDVVSMSGVRFRWRGPRAFSLAIESFALRAKERVLLVGPSGAGKSTFLSLLCGIVTPTTGRLEVLGTDMSKLSSSARDRFGAPELIVADEPTSALDRNRQQAFLDLLFADVAAAGASLIMVSHEEELGKRFDRVVRLDEIATAERSAAA